MTRVELVLLLLGQAKVNGFSVRRWYTRCLERPWLGVEEAAQVLTTERRYYALLFSLEFAQAFWKPGSTITFQVSSRTFQRTMPDGSIRTIIRKPYTRRSGRPDVWRYHLREMALSEEPLRYMRRYLRVEDELEEEKPPTSVKARTPDSGPDSRPDLKTDPLSPAPSLPIPLVPVTPSAPPAGKAQHPHP